jgi:hypothetical protein
MSRSQKISSVGRLRKPVVPLAFVEELLTCTDGPALVRKHLSINPAAVILGVITIFGGLEAGETLNCFDFLVPDEPTLDYLEEGLRILGLPDVADSVHTDLYGALIRFRKVCPSVNIELMQQNAAAMQLLFAN